MSGGYRLLMVMDVLSGEDPEAIVSGMERYHGVVLHVEVLEDEQVRDSEAKPSHGGGVEALAYR